MSVAALASFDLSPHPTLNMRGLLVFSILFPFLELSHLFLPPLISALLKPKGTSVLREADSGGSLAGEVARFSVRFRLNRVMSLLLSAHSDNSNPRGFRLDDCPSFRPHLLVRQAGADAAVVFSPLGDSLLEGRGYGEVSQLVDGHNTVARIVGALRPRIASRQVSEILAFFESQGILRLDGSSPAGPTDVFWSSFELEDDQAGSLEGKSVELLATHRDEALMLAQQLHSAGLLTRARGEFRIVIAADYSDARLEGLNKEAMSDGRPWMLVRPTGREVWIGPIFVPGRTACWRCLADRLEENFWLRECLGSEGRCELLQPLCGDLEPARRAALGLACVEAAKWFLMKTETPLCGRVWSLDLRSLKSRFHDVALRPQCRSCGPQGNGHSARAVPDQAAWGRAYAGETGHRCCSPQETLKRLERYLSPITGIVGGFECSSGGRSDGPYVCRGRYATATLALSSSSRLGGRPGIAVGKGFTPQDAQAGMMAEAVERYCMSFQGHEPRMLGRYGELSDRMVHPSELLHYSPRQYRRRREWNADLPAIHHIPDPFEESVPVEWVSAESLTDRMDYLLPAAYCYARYPLPEGHEYCMADSNGCASGNRREEAIVQGFLELVERDAAALWWYNRISRRAVCLRSFAPNRIVRTGDRFTFQNRSLHILDLTTDLEIPVFAAVSLNEKGQDMLVGLGAHFDARIALHRAVAELGQVLAFWPPRHDTFEAADPGLNRLLARWRERTIREETFLQPSGGPPAQADDFPEWSTVDLERELDACIRIARKNDLNLLVSELSRPDIDFAAVRVTVPGLRHFWPRFGPGRLFDVPVRMGWLSRTTQEEELNPFGFFL